MMKTICLIVSSEMTVKAFLLDQVAALSREYKVTVVAHTQDRGFLAPYGLDVEVVPMVIERAISPAADLRALCKLAVFFRQRRFDMIHSVSPKAGLLAMLAGRLTGVPLRLHVFTGQVWATRRGIGRWVLKSADRALARFATHLLADSGSQRDFLLEERVLPAAKICVLAEGSISGVDITRFRPNPEVRVETRRELGVPSDATLFLFLGRLNPDKGVLDLAHAFARLVGQSEKVHLAVVGPDEAGMRERVRQVCADHLGQLHFVDYTAAPERYMASADVLCLPSYREGFGSVIIEAAAVGIPTIASRIYGITDAMVDGRTGLLHTPGDVAQILDGMRTLHADVALRCKLGTAAQARAVSVFSKETLTAAVLDYYRSLLG